VSSLIRPSISVEAIRPNKLLQVTFDPPPAFATAKSGVTSNAPQLRRYPVPKKQMIDQLENYRGELSGIISRFEHRENGLYIDSNDGDRLQVLVIELRDLFQDRVGPNNYSEMIVDAYNTGRRNYIQSPSLASVKQIKGVVEAAITRSRNNPSSFDPKEEAFDPKSDKSIVNKLRPPEQVTLRWLYEHVPYRFWISLGAVIVAAFSAGGYLVSRLPFLQRLLGICIGNECG